MRGRCDFDHKHNVALRAQYQMREYNFTIWILAQADTIHSKLIVSIIFMLYVNYPGLEFSV